MSDILTFTTPEHRWLSNMAYVNIEHKGIIYPATENFYQAMKYGEGSVVFLEHTPQRQNIREYIATLSPKDSKKFSKEHPMNNVLFEENKIHVMLVAQRKKYAQEPFRSKLLATGNAHLEEGNWWHDHFWGVEIKTRKGENQLGKILMSVRQTLQDQEKTNANTNI